MTELNYPEPDIAKPTYGRALLESLPRELLARPVVHTQPDPWPLVAASFEGAGARIHMVETMEREHMRAVSDDLSDASAVFGVGGGMALDHAKYTAWRTGLPLVLLPTILSVDAAYTREIGVREGARVRYVGAVIPDHLLIDFDILEQAPPILNRAGANDVVSIYTALWDWREAHERLGEPYDPQIAAAAREVLASLFSAAEDLAAQNEAGLRALSEGFVAEVRLCRMAGSARPEEGSEHYLAYCLESMTRRAYVHGQLVGCCLLITAAFQGQDVDGIAEYYRAIGLDCSLRAIGSSRTEMRRALLHMGDYVKQETQLLPGVFHFRGGVTPGEADRVLDALDPIIGT